MKSTKIALVLLLFVAAMAMFAHAQQDVQVFVPGTASGYFGNPVDMVVPFVPAITVNGPATVTVTYVSGTVIWDTVGDSTGPNGTPDCRACKGMQFPLHEARGIGLGTIKNLGALIGAFVPQERAAHQGFSAIDGTKNATRGGIMPNKLFFIGEGLTFDVKEAGTLFLGINDTIVGDNSGGFTVDVTGP